MWQGTLSDLSFCFYESWTFIDCVSVNVDAHTSEPGVWKDIDLVNQAG